LNSSLATSNCELPGAMSTTGRAPGTGAAATGAGAERFERSVDAPTPIVRPAANRDSGTSEGDGISKVDRVAHNWDQTLVTSLELLDGC
jgi:hypothetical protein